MHCKPSNSLYRNYSSSLTFFFSSLKFVSFSLFIYPHLHSSIFFKKLFERCKIKRKMEWVKRERISFHTIGPYIVALQHYLVFKCTIGLYIYTYPCHYYSKTFSCTSFYLLLDYFFKLQFYSKISIHNIID